MSPFKSISKMRNVNILYSLIIFVLFSVFSSCGSNDKSPPNPSYSRSMQESKKNGVFEFAVIPFNSSLLFDSSHKLKIKNAWVENFWETQVHVIGKTSIEKGVGHQLILIYEIIKDTSTQSQKWYYFIGRKPIDDTLVHYYCTGNDSIKIPLYMDTLPFFPHKKGRKAYDSLTFVKDNCR